ncbi:conserved mitochondrial DUF3228 domain-containing protein [Andalucia godoyi]|uniref:Conserved mitochondrial DUF3228 domain-containing protein n=1 Tax=Andalucia godoyi TaxID=505711 RepID=A0A8K0AJZ1_ANDGO|nr:conserved mitochondrial DUF3228 domain-containing protein [Andalucia godoyi]|eukprot:ANDGO_08254.mRNA.1 conserved mitochondrial DUF3228 domain-containing protein
MVHLLTLNPSLRIFFRKFSCHTAMTSPNSVFLDPFCLRQFEGSFQGTRIQCIPEDFIQHINQFIAQNPNCFEEGYAPFCKHIFIPNFTDARIGYLAITPDNESLLRSGYESRTTDELPVLTRWFDAKDVDVPQASVLDLILYSREQIILENSALSKTVGPDHPMNQPGFTSCQWGLISIKSQDVFRELPMTPITMMRNALGKHEGGSGVPLEKIKYMASVDFWCKHALVKS